MITLAIAYATYHIAVGIVCLTFVITNELDKFNRYEKSLYDRD
jgi:hypothetical protein